MMNCKIKFNLNSNDEGYPPVSVELLNATSLGAGVYQIENAPFFVENISFHDQVRASPSEVSGQFEFEEVVLQSDFTSISILILDENMDAYLMDLLRGLDCVIEYGEFGMYRVLAVSVPNSTDYAALRGALMRLEAQDSISFAELSVGDSARATFNEDD